MSGAIRMTPEFRLLLDCSSILPASQSSRYSDRAVALCSTTDDDAIDWGTLMGLDEEMLHLFLCDHGSLHQWFRIKWLSDAAAMLSRCPDMGCSGSIILCVR